LDVIPLRGPLGTETEVVYTIKFVIADVADDQINSAVFIPTDGVRFLPVLEADFNLDGIVDAADLNILGLNFGQSGKTFREGDADFDGTVDSSDLTILAGHWLETGGYKYFSADFDGDQDVDLDDRAIWIEFIFTTNKCASRFEGDANGDGSVDVSDYNIWNDQRTDN